MAEVGRLMAVSLRELWNDESSEFTPWLAKEENLALLAETIGMDLRGSGFVSLYLTRTEGQVLFRSRDKNMRQATLK